MLTIEVVYIDETKNVFFKTLTIEEPITALEVLQKSRFFEQYSKLQKSPISMGIYSKKITADTLINTDCRIEVYRELTLSPMERRRLVAKKRAKAPLKSKN